MRTWSVTDRGLVRSENQDACAVLTPDGYTVAVVCDGMGGTQGGRMASAIAVETFTRELSRSLRPGMSAGQLEQAAGYAVEEDGRWHLTPKGFLVSNQIIGELLDAQTAEKQRRADATARGDFRVQLD